MEKRKSVEELLEDIDMGLLDMNIMQAMKMLHDTTRSYSDREKEYLNCFADIPLCDEDDEDDEK